jgi:DNA-binding NarL/FixJ family response regulator
MRNWASALLLVIAEDDEDGGLITVELRLADPELRKRITAWLERSEHFVAGVAGGGGGAVIVADHMPDDARAPVVLLGDSPSISSGQRSLIAARLSRSFDFATLRVAMEAAAHGLSVAPLAKPRAPPGDFAAEAATEPVELTRRESQVLRLIAEGASNKEIARRLGISAHTAKFHVASILQKLKAPGRTAAVIEAARLGLFML